MQVFFLKIRSRLDDFDKLVFLPVQFFDNAAGQTQKAHKLLVKQEVDQLSENRARRLVFVGSCLHSSLFIQQVAKRIILPHILVGRSRLLRHQTEIQRVKIYIASVTANQIPNP